MNREKAIKLIMHLRGLGNGSIDPQNQNFGLCMEIKHIFGISYAGLRSLVNWEEWHKYSGCVIYPVSIFVDWDIQTENGRDRRELCIWCADRIEQRLNKGEFDHE